jgi:hypothetical protein
VGAFPVAGRTLGELRKEVRERYDRVYTDYQLDVGLGGLKSLGVTVVGRVRQPGPRLRKLTPHSLQLRSPLLGSPLPLSKARLQAPPLLRRLPGCSGPQPHGSAA